MATLATIFRRTDAPAARGSARSDTRLKIAADPYKLRALPNDDVYFYSKRIDNSRIVRQPSPRARGECWSAIGATCIAAVLIGSVFAPSVANIFAGYKLQSLRQERQSLLDERRVLDVEEATLMSTSHLNELAGKRNLAYPKAGQVIRLNPSAGALALNRFQTNPR
ncbi:MAG: hypothetical protein M3Y07_00570 [Acidobacteriota bacterium]|nr:hypothetical protein [Acidobacteriota bacterium]